MVLNASYQLNTLLFINGDSFDIEQTIKVDMPLNKETNHELIKPYDFRSGRTEFR